MKPALHQPNDCKKHSGAYSYTRTDGSIPDPGDVFMPHLHGPHSGVPVQSITPARGERQGRYWWEGKG